MTHNEFRERLEDQLSKNCRISGNFLNSFTNGQISREEAETYTKDSKIMNVKGDIIVYILQALPKNDNTMKGDELWSIIEHYESRKKIAKKYREKIDDFYAELENWIDNNISPK